MILINMLDLPGGKGHVRSPRSKQEGGWQTARKWSAREKMSSRLETEAPSPWERGGAQGEAGSDSGLASRPSGAGQMFLGERWTR